jgi:asparagine N-glycosylation enzyme membrane subunit Stt3
MSSFSYATAILSRYKYGLALTLILGLAFFFRVYFPYDNVFAGDWVRFQQNDPWYHMRIVENLVQHFPHLFSFDPYGLYPDGQYMGSAPFFDLFLGFFVWLFGAGSPSKGLIETMGAYFPAILGALVTIPVYFICKTLTHRIAGLLAALLIAILPGEFLFRTLLGFTDHHAAEIFFSALAMMFLVLALKSARDRDITFSSLRNRDWSSLKKPLIYSVLTGITLAFYLLSWTGGALFIFILFLFAIAHYIIDHMRGNSTDYLCMICLPALLVALILVRLVGHMSGGYSLWDTQMASLALGILVFIALSGISKAVIRRNLNRIYYPLIIAVLIGIGLGFFYLIHPSLFNTMMDKINVLSPAGGELTISEAKGLSLDSAWEFFSSTFYISLICLTIIGYQIVMKKGSAEKTLLFVWSLIMVIAAFGQQRFAYYLAINVAVLTAYLSWLVLEFIGLKEITQKVQDEAIAESIIKQKEKEKSKLSKKAKRRLAQKRKRQLPVTSLQGPKLVYCLIALIIIFFVAFYPQIGKAVDWADAFRGPSNDWHDALTWMRENTPEPFPDDKFYYELYDEQTWKMSEFRADLLFEEGTGNPSQPENQQIQEQYKTGDNTQVTILGPIQVAQTFTPTEDHSIQFLSIKAFRIGYPKVLQVDIQGVDQEGHPDGNTLTSGVINANEFTDDQNGDWYTIALDSYGLSADMMYAIVLKCPDGDKRNYVLWRANQKSPGYEGGRLAISYDEGALWISYAIRESMYAVMSWWDPGYWITYIGHRIPNASPNGQAGAVNAANFLLAQDEASANEILNRHGTKYIILDSSNSFLQFASDGRLIGELHAFIAWAEKNPTDFYEVCYEVDGERVRPVLIYHPEYYRSMSSRLYIFGGEEWIPHETPAYSFAARQVTDIEGNVRTVKIITDKKTFNSYEDAIQFTATNESYEIVGTEFALSPVPLEKLENYNLKYKSPTTVLKRGDDTISQVEIFEYTP